MKAIERAFSKIRTIYGLDQRRLCEEYDALMAAQRPTYPTPEHLQGLDMVAEMMRAGTEYGDHHGSPRQVDREAGRDLPRSVDFSSFACGINIRALAPYRARSSQHAWIFSEDDIEASETSWRSALSESHPIGGTKTASPSRCSTLASEVGFQVRPNPPESASRKRYTTGFGATGFRQGVTAGRSSACRDIDQGDPPSRRI